eukprot:IDg17943t1
MPSTVDDDHPVEYGRTFALLRASCEPLWRRYVGHTFVTRVIDGSLPHAAYTRYLRQDWVFLLHYARAWALAAVKASTMNELRAATATAAAVADVEMAAHVAACADAGIDTTALAETRETVETVAYSRFVLDAGLRGDSLDLLVALAPCVLGYGEVGAALAQVQSLRNPDHPYATWAAQYSTEAYQSLCRDVGVLIDGAVAARIGKHPQESPRWQALQRAFEDAVRLEAAFWDMALREE